MSKISAIYTRQSLDKKDSLSIETQIEKCASLCVYKGKEYKIYRDKGYSGKDVIRPGFEEMTSDIKNGLIDEVIVYRLDRISRNLNDFTTMVSEFEKYGVTFASATESFDTATPMGRAMMYLLIVFAQLERENIAERIKDNALYRAMLGRWTGGVIPFGYKRIRINDDGKSKSILVPDDDETAIVKQFFDWYLDPNSSLRSLVRKANMLGLKTREGSEWSHSSVSRLLQNVIYATNSPEVYYYFKSHDSGKTLYNDISDFDNQHGMMYYRNRIENEKKRKGLKCQEQFIIVAEHSGIIDGADWVKVQQKLYANKRKPPRAMSGKASVLSGILKCGVCGSSMMVSSAKGPVKEHFYIKCRRKIMNGEFLCSNKTVRVDVLEAKVIESIKFLCNDKDFITNLINQAETINEESIIPLENQKMIIQEKIRSHEVEISNLISNLKTISSTYVTQKIEKEIESLGKEIEAFKNEIKVIQAEIQHANNRKFDKQYLIDNYYSFVAQFDHCSLDEKRQLIRGIVKDIVVTNNQVTINLYADLSKTSQNNFEFCLHNDIDVLAKYKNYISEPIMKLSCDIVDELPDTSIFNKISNLCIKNSMTIKELARKAGVSYGNIFSYRRKPNKECDLLILQKIAHACNLDIRYFKDYDLSLLSDRIQYFRVINMYSVTALAKKLGVLKDTISDWEHGNTIPKEINIKKLESIFKTKLYH